MEGLIDIVVGIAVNDRHLRPRLNRKQIDVAVQKADVRFPVSMTPLKTRALVAVIAGLTDVVKRLRSEVSKGGRTRICEGDRFSRRRNIGVKDVDAPLHDR